MSIAPAPSAPPAVKPVAALPRVWNPTAAFLSYLVPGLGQISQGRVSKGVLFFVCIYTLFFYGTVLGSGTTKLTTGPDPQDPTKKVVKEYRIASAVYLPDTAKDNNPLSLPTLPANLYNRPQFIAQFWVGIAAWPAIWQYNTESDTEAPLGGYQRTPTGEANNAVNTNVGRMLDLGWVLTVIAGVLNILVIYDALAGPAFLSPSTPEPKAT